MVMEDNMAYYNLPNGKATVSTKRYLKEWKTLTKFLKERFGLITIGFDPGFLVHYPCGVAFDLPTQFVIQLYNN